MGQRAIAKRLAEYFRTQAEFRGAKAEHYPDDPRNEKAMTALCALADYVEHRSPDDPSLVTMAHLQAPYGNTARMGGEGARLVSRFGFESAGQPTKSDFEALIEALIEVEIQASTEDVGDELGWEPSADADDA